ncbi:hypothetical protein BN1723_007695, partial [Verticillium longisporum]
MPTPLPPSSAERQYHVNGRAAVVATRERGSSTPRKERQGQRESSALQDPGLKDYRLGECLGKGAFGSVYKAFNWGTGEAVAVKQIKLADLPKSELRMIESEIDLLKNLHHDNIVKYLGSFFFSYDVDITRHWATRAQSPSDGLPLYRRVKPTFFWNRNTSQPFIDSGNDALVLPLMQGFVGQREFIMDKSPPQHDEDAKNALEMSNMSAPTSPPGSPPAEAIRGSLDLRASEKKFLITVISRRSIKRAGLRYLRRGVDEDGHVANAVETEQILSNSSWDKSSKIYSFLQIRGSIPLFFTQSPYSLKPAPVIQHSTEANFEASKKHFERLHREYGMLQVVNLVEKHNVEATIGNEYQNAVAKLNETVFSDHTSQVPFEWFDFHAACRGMKFENVSLLLDAMRTKLDELGSTVEKDGELFLRQRGVLRTNCMDCLDRTNVCQSSFAKYMLESQLKAEGYDLSMQVDQQSAWFNTLWADNGDSVSKQYASTAAMKGDYTRYKTRNYRGMLNDLGFSLTRFYNG